MAGSQHSSFDEPALQSQRIFRAAMMAMARPGLVREIDVEITPPAPLHPAAGALALALCDFETPIWLDPALARASVIDWLRFETAAPLVGEPAGAAFALIGEPADMPGLESFGLGSLEYPERSTTLILQVETLSNESGWSLAGPGIGAETRLNAGPLRPQCAAEMAQMRSLFPRGVDLFFVCGRRLAALPRSVLIEA